MEVCIPSLDTRDATELTIRSLRRSEGAVAIVVGDGGSTDGSIGMLREFERRGWLRLEVDPSRPRHHVWIERWIERSTADVCVFCDSDVEFLRPGVVSRLVGVMNDSGAAVVGAELVPEMRNATEPVGGSAMRAAARLSAWLFAVDPGRVRDVAVSFAFALEPSEAVREGAIGYDTGARWFAAVQAAGLPWAAMPGRFARGFRHFGGLTWQPILGVGDDRQRERVLAEIRARCRSLAAEQD